MSNRFKWKAIAIKEKVTQLCIAIDTHLEAIPLQNSRSRGKLERWGEQLKNVHDGIIHITRELGEQIDRTLKTKIRKNELFQVAMFQPSTRNLFMELALHFRERDDSPLSQSDFQRLVSLCDVAEVLAMFGDAALDIGVLHYLWRDRLNDVGELTQRRAALVSNENMARVSDRWGLYEARIHFDPPTSTKSEIEHIKGTLLEALYGAVYIVHGFNKLLGLVHFLDVNTQ